MKSNRMFFLILLVLVVYTCTSSCKSRYEAPPTIEYKYEVGQLVYVHHEPFIVQYCTVRNGKPIYNVSSLVNENVTLRVLEVYINPAKIKIETYGEKRRE